MTCSGAIAGCSRGLLAALAATAALLFVAAVLAADSPLHRDDPVTGRTCALCQLQHVGLEPAAAGLDLPSPAHSTWPCAPAAYLLPGEPATPRTKGRAPPSVSSLSV